AFFIARRRVMFSSGGFSNLSLIRYINSATADLVHLHWVNSGGMSVSEIAQIKKPVVWTHHAMCDFTGRCYYDAGFDRYVEGCRQCPALKSSSACDLSSMNVSKKANSISAITNLTVVGVSRWLADCALKSIPLSKARVVHLPNPINVRVFHPVEKTASRQKLGLPVGKKLVLFGAIAAVEDRRKGFEELTEALKLLSCADVELVVFGGHKPKKCPGFCFNTHWLGHIDDDELLRTVYSAADVMVVPSLQEAFGQTATEAMACGTPVVAFGATGLLDIVDHQVNGYLAEPYYPSSLAEGIEWVLGHPNYEELSMNARKKVETSFDYKVVAEKYKRLYEEC